MILLPLGAVAGSAWPQRLRERDAQGRVACFSSLVRQRFAKHRRHAAKLLAAGDGRILMDVRPELQAVNLTAAGRRATAARAARPSDLTADGNLGRMTTMTDESRAAIARGWNPLAQNQAEYARQHGISERTLRTWRRRYVPTGMPVEAARDAIRQAIGKLQAILADLGAEAACRPPGEDTGPATSETRATPEPVDVPAQVAAEAHPASAVPTGGDVEVMPPTASSFPENGKKSFFDWEAEDEPQAAPEPVVQATVPTSRPVLPVPPVQAAGPLPMPAPGALVW